MKYKMAQIVVTILTPDPRDDRIVDEHIAAYEALCLEDAIKLFVETSISTAPILKGTTVEIENE